jgi:hypothetical protein
MQAALNTRFSRSRRCRHRGGSASNPPGSQGAVSRYVRISLRSAREQVIRPGAPTLAGDLG